MFQSLEQRRLFSWTITNINGNVTFTGTNAADELSIYSSEVSDGNPWEEHPNVIYHLPEPKLLKSLTINSLGGDDIIDSYSTQLYYLTDQYQFIIVNYTINSGDGNDSVYSSKDEVTVNSGAGNDYVLGGQKVNLGDGNDRYYGEVLDGGDYGTNESIIGGNGNDSIYGEGGDDTIFGNDGNDLIQTQTYLGHDLKDFSTVDAGAGHDRVELNSSGKVLLGSGDDRAYFMGGREYYGSIDGEAGKDWIQVKDTVHLLPGKQFKLSGGDGKDTIIGSKFNDLLDGGNEADIIYGNYGNDTIKGGNGNDTLDGDQGNDKIYGGEGDDKLIGDTGRDSLYGENGIDTLIANDGEKDTLSGGLGNDIYQKDLIDTVID